MRGRPIRWSSRRACSCVPPGGRPDRGEQPGERGGDGIDDDLAGRDLYGELLGSGERGGERRAEPEPGAQHRANAPDDQGFCGDHLPELTAAHADRAKQTEFAGALGHRQSCPSSPFLSSAPIERAQRRYKPAT